MTIFRNFNLFTLALTLQQMFREVSEMIISINSVFTVSLQCSIQYHLMATGDSHPKQAT